MTDQQCTTILSVEHPGTRATRDTPAENAEYLIACHDGEAICEAYGPPGDEIAWCLGDPAHPPHEVRLDL